jgi:hypothetical protein
VPALARSVVGMTRAAAADWRGARVEGIVLTVHVFDISPQQGL